MTHKSMGMMKRKKIDTFRYHFLMVLVGFVMMYPFLWLLGSSLKPNEEIFTTVRNIIPRIWTINNYLQGWKGFAGFSFTTFFKNSLFVSVIATIGTAVSASLVAFGFARLRFPGRGIWFATMLVTMMLPGQVLMIPRFVLFNDMHMTGSFWPLTLPEFFGNAGEIFMVMQFIKGIPKDMDEAARIDGCSWYGILTRIHIPLIKPAVITVTVMAFMNTWQDFMGPLLYLNGPDQYTVAYALKMFNDSTGGVDYGATFAMSVLSLIPILVLFFCFQRQLVEGIHMEGLKG